VRFREDPVRMLRAVALAARLDFTIDRDTTEAVRSLRGEIVKSSSARLLDEFYKILRQGASRRTFEALHQLGLLAYLLPEADTELTRGTSQLLASLGRLDEHRNAENRTPDAPTNPLLVGTLLVPLGMQRRRVMAPPPPAREDPDAPPPEAAPEPPDDVATEMAALGETEDAAPAEPQPLSLPFARRDLDRVRLILAVQRRLRETSAPTRVKRMLASRPYFADAISWMEIHGGAEGQELAAHWRSLDVGDIGPPASPGAEGVAEPPADLPPREGRRRRRRRRRRPAGAPGATS
jgi:poly(A) polymerase